MRNIVLKNDLDEQVDETSFLMESGWTTLEQVNEDSRLQRSELSLLGEGKRYFGDPLSWKIHFENGHGAVEGPVNEDTVEEEKITRNTFNLIVPTGKWLPEIQFKVLKPVFFKETYAASHEVAYKAKFWFALIRALEAQIECGEACE